jgi:long-chain-fatty-acid--[acyl-carrier-protein] ligase
MGFCKFFAVTHLSESIYDVQDKDWIIQVVGSLLTFGAIVAYPIACKVTMRYTKSKVIQWTCATTACWVGAMALIPTQASVWLTLLGFGWISGIFSAAKMSTVALESQNSQQSTTSVNAKMSITYILGMICGVVVGTSIAMRFPQATLPILCSVFLICAFQARHLSYSSEDTKSKNAGLDSTLKTSINLFSRYPFHLSASPLLWGLAASLSLSLTAYCETQGFGSAESSSLMSLFAVLGTIAGNLLSTKVKGKTFTHAGIATFSLSLLIITTTTVAQSAHMIDMGYIALSLWMTAMGASFGYATNLIDANFLEWCAKEKCEGPAASIQSFFVGLSCFVIGGLTGLFLYTGILSVEGQFILFCFISLITITLLIAATIQKSEIQDFIRHTLLMILRAVLSLRYKVTIHGLNKLPMDGKGILVLPNHPAEIDPVLVTTAFAHKIHLQPIVIEEFFNMKALRPIMKLINALPMPDLSLGHNAGKVRRMKNSFTQARQDLSQGKSLLMYPSGQLMRSGKEKLGANSGISKLVSGENKPHVIAVRTRGLWGSSFSTALNDGQTPDLFHALKQGIIATLKNFFFFNPRREVEMTIEIIHPEDLNLDTLELNQKLESFYNQNGEETLIACPYSKFWPQQRLNQKISTNESVNHDPKHWDQDLAEAFATKFEFQPKSIQPHTRLADDLAMDSIQRSECLQWLEDEYDITHLQLKDIETMNSLMTAIAEKPQDSAQNQHDDTDSKLTTWEYPSGSGPISPVSPKANNIAIAFLENCERLQNRPMCADAMTGVMSTKRFKTAVLLMAETFKQWPEKRVGLMLPASNAAAISLMALILAKKTPVLLNWTVGQRNLSIACEEAQLDKIICSEQFMNKLKNVDFEELNDNIITLEELSSLNWGWGSKAIAHLNAGSPIADVISHFELSDIQPEHEAILLFTSGSESRPKGVPLSHKNILSNVRSAMDVIPFDEQDVLYGFLPPFHSFGLTVTTIMPLVSGVRVAYHPNPTEYRRIAKGCEGYRITRLCGTPTFISGILNASKDEQLSSIKTFVLGAEKMPSALAERVNALETGAEVLEGYGITECSPVLCLNRPNQSPEGVGQALPNVDIDIVDPDNLESLPQGERGLILAKGPNVFGGYLGERQDPFVTHGGEKWYNTGDLGYISQNGNLILAGRMKRFVKVAGEMVSLPAMEEALLAIAPHSEGPALAIQATEMEDQRPILTLVSTFECSVDTANLQLRKSGFSNVCKINRKLQVESLPLLGTGKINFQGLKELVQKNKNIKP